MDHNRRRAVLTPKASDSWQYYIFKAYNVQLAEASALAQVAIGSILPPPLFHL